MELYYNISAVLCQEVFSKAAWHKRFGCPVSRDSFDIIAQQKFIVNTYFLIFLNFFQGIFWQQYLVFSALETPQFWDAFHV